MDNHLSEVIKESPAIVHKERYAYLKTKEAPSGKYFMIANDSVEVTVVAEEREITKVIHEKEVKWFKLIEFKVSVPFKGVGFLAAITKAIASKDLNVLVVSTFSKDYVLVREAELKKAITSLEEIGFSVYEEK